MRWTFNVALLVLSACGNVPAKNESTKPPPPIASFVERFAASHLDWLQNEITEERTNAAFRDSLIDFYKTESCLDGLPLQLREVSRSGKGQYVAFFKLSEPVAMGERRIHFEAATILAAAMVDSLKSGAVYTTHGKFIKLLDDDLSDYNPPGTNNTAVHFGALGDSTYYLGLPLFKAERITPVR